MDLDHPLLLLLNTGFQDAVLQLSEFVKNDERLHFYSSSSNQSPQFRLVFDTITFSVEVVEPSEDVTSFQKIFCTYDPAKVISAIQIALDGNVEGGARVAPIASTLLEIGAYFASHFNAVAVAWQPSKIVSDTDYFIEAITEYRNGGVFPALALIDFVFSDNGQSARTCGLSWFSGQEVELTSCGLSKAEMVRRLVRIVHDVAVNEPINSDQSVADLDGMGCLSNSCIDS